MVSTIHDAKTQLSRLIERALAGEEIVIARGKQPLVRLVPLEPTQQSRSFGGLKIELSDDFDAPLSEFSDYVPGELSAQSLHEPDLAVDYPARRR